MIHARDRGGDEVDVGRGRHELKRIERVRVCIRIRRAAREFDAGIGG